MLKDCVIREARRWMECILFIRVRFHYWVRERLVRGGVRGSEAIIWGRGHEGGNGNVIFWGGDTMNDEVKMKTLLAYREEDLQRTHESTNGRMNE